MMKSLVLSICLLVSFLHSLHVSAGGGGGYFPTTQRTIITPRELSGIYPRDRYMLVINGDNNNQKTRAKHSLNANNAINAADRMGIVTKNRCVAQKKDHVITCLGDFLKRMKTRLGFRSAFILYTTGHGNSLKRLELIDNEYYTPVEFWNTVYNHIPKETFVIYIGDQCFANSFGDYLKYAAGFLGIVIIPNGHENKTRCGLWAPYFWSYFYRNDLRHSFAEAYRLSLLNYYGAIKRHFPSEIFFGIVHYGIESIYHGWGENQVRDLVKHSNDQLVVIEASMTNCAPCKILKKNLPSFLLRVDGSFRWLRFVYSGDRRENFLVKLLNREISGFPNHLSSFPTVYVLRKGKVVARVHDLASVEKWLKDHNYLIAPPIIVNKKPRKSLSQKSSGGLTKVMSVEDQHRERRCLEWWHQKGVSLRESILSREKLFLGLNGCKAYPSLFWVSAIEEAHLMGLTGRKASELLSVVSTVSEIFRAYKADVSQSEIRKYRKYREGFYLSYIINLKKAGLSGKELASYPKGLPYKDILLIKERRFNPKTIAPFVQNNIPVAYWELLLSGRLDMSHVQSYFSLSGRLNINLPSDDDAVYASVTSKLPVEYFLGFPREYGFSFRYRLYQTSLGFIRGDRYEKYPNLMKASFYVNQWLTKNFNLNSLSFILFFIPLLIWFGWFLRGRREKRLLRESSCEIRKWQNVVLLFFLQKNRK